MIESAVTDLPLPDSPTTPSVPPGVELEVDAVDGADQARLGRERRAQVLDAEQRARVTAPGVLTVMWRSTAASTLVAVARLHRLQQLAVLDRDLREVGGEAVAEEVGADARRDAAPHLRRVRLSRAREHELMEADVGLDQAQQLARARALGHHPDLLRQLGEVGVVHLLERLREAEALEREADRDQHLLDLLLGDAEHDRAAVRVRDDEALVLELAQRLADGAAARLQLARDPLLDQPVAVGERPTVIASRR